MNIVIVSDTLSMLAGTEYSVVMTATMLARRGHDVKVLAYEAYGPVHETWRRYLTEASIPVRVYPCVTQNCDSLRNLIGEVREYLRAIEPDIVHAIPMESLSGQITKAVSGLGATVLFGSLTSDPHPRCFWYGDLDAGNLSQYDRILVASKGLGEGLINYRCPGARVSIVPQLIRPPIPPTEDDRWFLTESDLANRFHLAAITRLRVEKGPEFLIAAFSQIVSVHANCQLSIYGDLSELVRAKEVAAALQVQDRIIWSGPFDGLSETDRILGQHCIVLLSSLFEGMPIALMEALARGRPCVATAVGGVRDLFDATGGGISVPPGDPKAMADAAVALIQNPDLLRSMGARARERFPTLFGETIVCEQLIANYLEAIRAHGGQTSRRQN